MSKALSTGDVAAFVRSHMNGLQPLKSTIEKKKRNNAPLTQKNNSCWDDK